MFPALCYDRFLLQLSPMSSKKILPLLRFINSSLSLSNYVGIMFLSYYYGNRWDEVLTERSRQGTGFLARVCFQWEGALARLKERGIWVVMDTLEPF